jgi:hypothetical protein
MASAAINVEAGGQQVITFSILRKVVSQALRFFLNPHGHPHMGAVMKAD